MPIEWPGGMLVFEWPGGLWGLAVLPLLAGWMAWSGVRAWAALALRVVGATLVVLAVAGLSVEREEAADELCVVVVTDVSESVGPDGRRLAEEWTDRLLDRLGPDDRYGTVVFGARAEVVRWPAPPGARPGEAAASVDAGATRIAEGIETALPLCPEGMSRKLLLISDGNETAGNARRAAALAAQTGIRVYAVAPGPGLHEGFSFEKLTAPPLVREGSTFPLRLVVRGREKNPAPGSISILLDGEPVSERDVAIDPGVNVFEIPYQIAERGSYRIGANVRQGDVDVRRELSLAVAGPIRALVVTEAKDPALARALRLRTVDVEFVSPGELPELDELLAYHCVVVDDVEREAFREGALETLESYVRSFGGGLLMTGGVESFGDRRYQGSPLERALPVRFREQKPRPKGRAAMGVFLLIDRSNSMSYNSRRRDARDGEKMSYAKKAALELVGQLKPNDQVGVIAFDSDPYVIGPLMKLSEHRRRLEDRIARLLPGGGTDFKASLEIASAQLVASGLTIRHVILLTDGDTNRGASDHEALISHMSRLGISVTTIRIGTDDVNLDLLRKISRETGGRFYHVQDIEQLPQLVVSDTKKVERERDRQAAVPSRYRLRVDEKQSPVIRGFRAGDFPPLRRLVRADMKRGADRVLYGLDEEHAVPLLATWQYGLGRTAAFLLDPTSTESRRWVSWPGFAKLWSQLVRWAIREDAPWETRHTVRFEDGEAVLEMQTFDADARGTVVARIFTTPEESVEVELAPVAPRVYRAVLPPLPSGRYALLLKRVEGDDVLSQKRDVLVLHEAVDDDGTLELARKLPDLDLLREITAAGGGRLDPDVDEMVAREGRVKPVRAGLDAWLIPLALALLLGDIWLRRRRAARIG